MLLYHEIVGFQYVDTFCLTPEYQNIGEIYNQNIVRRGRKRDLLLYHEIVGVQ